jgi:type IV pilus assembly protein PilF
VNIVSWFSRSSARSGRCRTWSAVGLLTVGLYAGCAGSEEAIQKSKGYYQEGVASLSSDRQKSFVSFQKSVQLNPNNKDARYALGHIYAQQGKLALAEEQFREAIQIDEAFSEAHTYLGQVLANQDRWDEAIKAYRQALTNPLYPTPDLARFHLGRALAHQGDLQASMEMLEDAVTVNPPSISPAMTHLELGRLYYKMGYNAKAREVLTKVATMDKGGQYGTAAAELLLRIKQ